MDGSPLEPGGTRVVIPGYDWAPHDASLFASEYATKKTLSWRVGRLYVVRDVEDSRLIRAGVSLQNERVYHGKETSPDDFFYILAFSMSDRTNFHMSSSQWALIEPLSEADLTNTMLEMSTRAASLAWYLRDFADRRGFEAIWVELLAEKKASEDLRAAMDQMLLAQDDSDKKIDELQAELDEVKKSLARTSNQLRDARADRDRLREECGQLKVIVTRQNKTEGGLLQKNRALTDDLVKAKEKISKLETGIVFEHEEGFNKALRQASVLAGIQEPYALGFDIQKHVFDGVLVHLIALVAEDEPQEMEDPLSAGVVDQRVEVADEAIEDVDVASVANDGRRAE
ncbi:hypothetical protein LR48_Vigan11g103000 [Vigna angularis]|uniref:Uncharacterized protein n=1 Tax=Phaseolus angularis TaxID=3914 RepID=A0A0L9VT26_PHAAN|nr:hypothetical protein LR48_Vigan11g103000 [Vigna angularis]